jgi:hypothetical protein
MNKMPKEDETHIGPKSEAREYVRTSLRYREGPFGKYDRVP